MMKEAVGESAMTIITISLVAGAVIAIGLIISTLLNNQSMRANCENAGYSYYNGSCHNDLGTECKITSDGECE